MFNNNAFTLSNAHSKLILDQYTAKVNERINFYKTNILIDMIKIKKNEFEVLSKELESYNRDGIIFKIGDEFPKIDDNNINLKCAY